MDKIEGVEWRILEGYYLLNQQRLSEDLLMTYFKLKETDDMMQLRELVNHIERLVDKGFLWVEENFYESSDKISFDYMNAAIAVTHDNVKLTDLGSSLVEDYFEKNNQSRLFKWKRHVVELFSLTIAQWLLVILFGALCFYGGYLWAIKLLLEV